MNLTDRQKQYIWIAGSFPDRIVEQGRGYRTKRLMYALNKDDDTVVIFGYGTPLYWLVNRGLFRKLQARNTFTLTEEGEAVFRKLLATQAGMRINPLIREVRVKEREDG